MIEEYQCELSCGTHQRFELLGNQSKLSQQRFEDWRFSSKRRLAREKVGDWRLGQKPG